jgi:ABC-type transporter Mla subunit MlaD
MEERDKKTELLVGFFLLVGLLLVSGLILEFSSVREFFKPTYDITSTFPDGSGIGESTPVMLGGSKIGKVKAKPLLNSNFNGVVITMEIYNTVHIPTDARFTIGTQGLLGDSFIEIKTTGATATEYLQPGAVVNGEAGKLSNLQETADRVAKKVDVTLDDIRDTVKDLRTTVKHINEGALSEEAMKDLKETFKHINSVATRLDEKTFGEDTSKEVKEAIASFKNAAHSLDDAMKDLHPIVSKVDGVMAKVDGVVVKADKVMVTADGALKSIDKTAVTLGDTARDLRKGNGLLPALLGDEQLKREFKELISNLKEHGVLFYRNDAARKNATADSDTRDNKPKARPSTGTRR